MNILRKSKMASLTYTETTRKVCKAKSDSWRHCAHVMIYSNIEKNCYLFKPNNKVAQYSIMMQMRFDGRLGFPGGFIDEEDKSWEAGLKRELHEEMGNIPPTFEITKDDYLSSHLLEEKKYCLHFYAKEVSFKDYLSIETRNSEQQKDFEVLGIFRVPLYTIRDNKAGLPAFLRNNFIGHSRVQLLNGIRAKGLLSDKYLQQCLENSKLPDPLSSTVVDYDI